MILLVSITLQIALLWGLTVLALTGIGLGVRRLWMGTTVQVGDIFTAYWVGMAVCIACLQVWHIWLPINTWAWWGMLGVGLGCLALTFPDWRGLMRRPPSQSWWFWGLFGVIVLMSANNALLAPARYDAGLYQIQSVMWSNQFPIVRGLGNLHGRLAFNNSFHLYIAWLNLSWLSGKGVHLANGAPLLMLWGGSVYALYRYVVRRDTHPHTLYWVVISPLFLRHLFQISLYSPDNDLMILIVGVILCGLLLEILLENSPTPASRYRLVVGAAWLGLGLTFKLSFGMIGGWVYLMMWAVQAFRRQARLRTFVLAGMVGALIFVPWLARGVLLSGYPAYPSVSFPFAVDWRMPTELGAFELQWARAWARFPGVHEEQLYTTLHGWAWLPAWMIDTFMTTPNLFDVTLPMGIVVIALAVKFRRRDGWRVGWWYVLPLMVGLVVWFNYAPSPRFAGSTFWSLMAGVVALLASEHPIPSWGSVLAVMCLVLLPFEYRIVFPHPQDVFYPTPEPQVLEPFVTQHGTTFTAVLDTDQCWDTALPCAPFYHRYPEICEREAGNIGAGYAFSGVPLSACDRKETP